jgi:hypothetical protein
MMLRLATSTMPRAARDDGALLRELERLKRENLALGDRIAELEEVLSPDRIAIPIEWGLTKQNRKVFACLLARPMATHAMLRSAMYDDSERDEERLEKNAIVAIFHLRAKLKPFGVHIERNYGFGYFISEESRRALLHQLAPKHVASFLAEGITRAHIEAGARALCSVVGIDPQSETPNCGQQVWERRTEEASACLVAAAAVRS